MLARSIKRFIGKTAASPKHGEQPPSFYDQVYENSEEYAKPFWQSRYYFLWTVIIDRLRRQRAKNILEIGCGSGQFAELLNRDIDVTYTGMDVSTTAIKHAESRQLARFEFVVDDALISPLLDGDYDTVVCTEVLEHLERDLDLVQRIRPGSRCLCTVPNFPYISHVRHFENEEQVSARYGEFFDCMTVWGLAGSHREGTIYFLFDGIRKADNNRSVC